MITTKPLEKLCDFLGESKIYWEELAERYKRHPEYSKDKEFVFCEYERAFKDNYLKNALDKASKKLKILITPLAINSKKYYSRRDELWRVHVYARGGNKKSYAFVSYENSIMVERVPAIVESCIAHFVPKARMRREEEIMQKEFRGNYAHIIVLPGSFFRTQPVRKFSGDGGLICRFPLSRERFREELMGVLARNSEDFKIKSPNKVFK